MKALNMPCYFLGPTCENAGYWVTQSSGLRLLEVCFQNIICLKERYSSTSNQFFPIIGSRILVLMIQKLE